VRCGGKHPRMPTSSLRGHPPRSLAISPRHPRRGAGRRELAVGGVALALGHDVVELEIRSVVGLDVEDADELGLERVFAGRIHHLLLDLGILGTESDEDQLVATNALARRESDVVASVAAVVFASAGQKIVGELLIVGGSGVALVG